MRFKWSKLLMNLGNALEAAVGPDRPRAASSTRAARAEAEAVIAAAGIDCASTEEDAERRGDLISHAADRRASAAAAARRGRASPAAPGSIEADLLNGEIVLLGRLHGVPTPVNELLQHGRPRAGPHPSAPPGSLHRGRPPGSPRLTV